MDVLSLCAEWGQWLESLILEIIKLSELYVLQVQILLQRRGLSLNPITTMYYIAPASFLFLSVPWGFIEARQLFNDDKVWA